MDITIYFSETIPVIKCKGRFDGAASAQFDAKRTEIPLTHKYVLMDLTEADYLSSIGVRSILKFERTLKTASGNLFLSINSEFIIQVLKMTGIYDELNIHPSEAEAIKHIKSEINKKSEAMSATIADCDFIIQKESDEGAVVDIWLTDTAGAAKKYHIANLQELSLSFGIGCFGENYEASKINEGKFISAKKLLGIIPQDKSVEKDFITAKNPDDVYMFVKEAISIQGSPSFTVKPSVALKIQLKNFINELFIAVSDQVEKPVADMGLILSGKMSAKTGEQDFVLLGFGMRGGDKPAMGRTNAPLLFDLLKDNPLINDICFDNCAVLTSEAAKNIECSHEEFLSKVFDLENLSDMTVIAPEDEISVVKAWIFLSKKIEIGSDKTLKIEMSNNSVLPDEWDVVVRKIYRDCSKAIISELHGGYTAKTFSIASFDKDGRKLLPTVLKICEHKVARQEEFAGRQYVEKFILNNSASVMGAADFGKWTGVRYNFLGITGADSKLEWLRKYYLECPSDKLKTLFDKIFPGILKPWYGQPKLEPVFLYRDNNPCGMFQNIFYDAEKNLGISAEADTIFCEELNIDLPNPYKFLKYEYPKRASKSIMWYTSITHGDLNMQNILLDEKENIYIIDFSETRHRNIVSDFGRLEPIFKIELTRLETKQDLKNLLEFELALSSADYIDEIPPFKYSGDDPMVFKAYDMLCLLRKYADKTTIFERDIIPYLVAMLEWTYPIISYIDINILRKKYSAYSAAIICKKILELEKSAR